MIENPIFSKLTGFDWDLSNKEKNRQKHNVQDRECEEAFFNKPLLIYPDEKHSQKETRHHALGVTNAGRLLFLSFTVRHDRVRVISARDQSRKEKGLYEKTKH